MRHRDHNPIVDMASRYSRSEVAERVKLPEDVIAFWSRSGMLRNVEGGDGKGSHRKFAPPQITIAAIIGEVRSQFGASSRVLQSLAGLLQDSVELFEGATLHVANWEVAARLSTNLEQFRSGGSVMIWRDDDEIVSAGEDKYERSARSEAEIVAGAVRCLDFDDPADVIRAAEKFPAGRDLQASIATTILSPLLSPGYQECVCWLLRLEEAGWRLVEGANHGADFQNFNPTEFGSAMFLPVDAIIRRAWGIGSGRDYLNEARVAAGKDPIE